MKTAKDRFLTLTIRTYIDAHDAPSKLSCCAPRQHLTNDLIEREANDQHLERTKRCDFPDEQECWMEHNTTHIQVAWSGRRSRNTQRLGYDKGITTITIDLLFFFFLSLDECRDILTSNQPP